MQWGTPTAALGFVGMPRAAHSRDSHFTGASNNPSKKANVGGARAALPRRDAPSPNAAPARPVPHAAPGAKAGPGAEAASGAEAGPGPTAAPGSKAAPPVASAPVRSFAPSAQAGPGEPPLVQAPRQLPGRVPAERPEVQVRRLPTFASAVPLRAELLAHRCDYLEEQLKKHGTALCDHDNTVRQLRESVEAEVAQCQGALWLTARVLLPTSEYATSADDAQWAARNAEVVQVAPRAERISVAYPMREVQRADGSRVVLMRRRQADPETAALSVSWLVVYDGERDAHCVGDYRVV
jgi:hypothetical protein